MSGGWILAVALSGFGAALAGEGDGLTLAVRGEPPCREIVVADEPYWCARYAAEELADHLFKATRVRLPIVTERFHAADAPAVFVGETRAAAAALGASETAQTRTRMGTDGFRLFARSSDLYVFGAAERGALYGVYDLLERYAGCRWYASWMTRVPDAERVTVPASVDRLETPAFAMREPFWYDLLVHPDFAARLRVNSRSWRETHLKFGGSPFRFGGGLGSCHTFNALLPPDEFFPKHPEWFSEENGRRVKTPSQWCLTNHDLLKFIAPRVVERIRRDPGAAFYGVSQNDWNHYCQCAKCRAVDDEEGSHAGTLVRFVNSLADLVRRECPGVRLETLAYMYTRKPPLKTTLSTAVVPCLCTIECDFSRPLDQSGFKQNVDFCSDIAGWGRQTPWLYVWDYVTNFRTYVQPFGNVYTLQDNLRFFLRNGVKAIFEQGDYQGYHGDFAELKAWLLAKWMWNPDLPLESLLDDFLPGYYGQGAPFVRTYLDELHREQRAVTADPKKPLTIYADVTTPTLSDGFLERAEKLWRQAEAATAADAATHRNVRMGAVGVDVLRLERLRAHRPSTSLLWLSRASASADATRAELRTRAASLLQRVREGTPLTLSESPARHASLTNAWAELMRDTRPALVTSGSDCGIVEDCHVRCAKPGVWGTFVDDPKAGDGRALRLENTHYEWCAMLSLDRIRFDEGARYSFRIRVRVDRVAAGEAFWAGVYDERGRRDCGSIRPRTDETSPDYVWYDVCTCVPPKGSYFWMGPGRFAEAGRSAVRGVWLDKIEIQRKSP